MANIENQPDAKQQVGIEKRFELAEGYVKTVLTLSTGALVLSVTFLHDIVGIGSPEAAKGIAWRSLIVSSWVALLISAVASLFYLYHLAIASKYQKAFSRELEWGAKISSAGLLVGLALLSLFASINLP